VIGNENDKMRQTHTRRKIDYTHKLSKKRIMLKDISKGEYLYKYMDVKNFTEKQGIHIDIKK
jgi:hypothetical protein